MSIISQLNKGQEQGLRIVVGRIKNKEKYSTIGGYAGTGKTFLVNAIMEYMGYTYDDVAMASFTGKAALRLQEFGHLNAKTLHNLLYKTIKVGGNFIHTPYPREEFVGLKLIIVDEVSMVPDNIVRTLANTGVHIIFLGDPFQLPPIGKDNGLLANPHVLLTEIMRRGDMNTITEFSERLRLGKKLPKISDEFIRVHEKEEFNIGMGFWADQILCGTNKTRHSLNYQMRQEHGFYESLPMQGDKLLWTRNNWKLFGNKGYSLVNGMIGYAMSDASNAKEVISFDTNAMVSHIDFSPDFDSSERFERVKFDAKPFLYEPLPNGQLIYSVDNSSAKDPRDVINTVDFGYAVTVHKAQGSEYKKVLGLEERMRGSEHARWMYTMATRSSDKLVIIRDRGTGIWE